MKQESRRQGRERSGFNLVEVLIATAIILVVIVFVMRFFASGRKTLNSTERKVEASVATHLRFEEIRHVLECCAWAWTPAAGKAGGNRIVTDAGKISFDSATGRITMGGIPRPGQLAGLSFNGRDPFLFKFVLTCDKASGSQTGRPRERERSTLVSKVFLETAFEDVRERNHVFELKYRWAVGGPAVHYPFSR